MRIPVEIKREDLDHSKLPSYVGIVGSREFEKRGVRQQVYADMLRFINKLKSGTTIVSGGAIGADSYAEEIAKNFHRPFELFLPDNTIKSPQRYYKRNRELVEFLASKGGVIIGFVMQGHHGGTTNTFKHARELKVPRLTFVYDEHGQFIKIICDQQLLKEFVHD